MEEGISGEENKKSSENRVKITITGEVLIKMEYTEIPSCLVPIFPQTGVVAIGGSSDVGKSSFLRQAAIAFACGEQEFLGFKINAKWKSVIYVSTEDDQNSISVLLKKQNVNKYDGEKFKSLRYIFETEDLIKKLDAELTGNPADCVMIDTFTDLYPGDMNATNKIRSFLNDFGNLAKKHGCLFIFLAHTGKGKENELPSKNNLLGSQGFEAKMRMVIELRKDVNDPSIRHLCIVKGNYLPADYKDRSYVLKFNQNMTFINTGQRIPFSDLLEKEEKDDQVMIERIKTLNEAGLSVRKIEDQLKEEGYKIGRTKIAEIINSFKK